MQTQNKPLVKKIASYDIEYAMKNLRRAIDYAEITGDFQSVRKWMDEVQYAYECKRDENDENLECVMPVTQNIGQIRSEG